MINRSLIERILEGYALSPMGTHGLPHWGRVLETGVRLAAQTGANPDVVELFAVFHDSRRNSEANDPGHGRRGADLARRLRSDHLSLTDRDFDLLITACNHHTDGSTHADITVQTCWDADRLDLWRIFITPKNALLCTDAAKEKAIQEWARTRSLSDYRPPFVSGWLGRAADGAS
jgi:uncharacterized protein